MAKKKVKKKEEAVLSITEREWRMAIDSIVDFEQKVVELEQRIDNIILAHEKCRSLKGI